MRIRCALCESPEKETVRKRIRNGVARRVFACRTCRFVYLEPSRESSSYYRSEAYRRGHGPAPGVPSSPREVFDAYRPNQNEIVARLRRILREETKVLDVGCSAGHFLDALKGRVGTRVGLELNEADVEFIRRHLDFDVYAEPLETASIEEGPFDLVTAFQVLEHVERPVEFLERMASQLRSRGYVYLEVPNHDDALLTAYDIPEYAEFFYREPHLSYFSKTTLARATARAGFKGRIETVQRYSMINHLRWIQTRLPTPSYREATAPARPATGASAHTRAINRFFARADAEYRALLARIGVGETLTFFGRKVA